MRTPSLAPLLLLAVVVAPPAYAEDWVQIASGSSPEPVPDEVPGAPDRGAMVFDSSLGTMVLFGGLGNAAETPMWQWDGTHWQPLTVVANPTSAAGGPVAYARDTGRGVTVVYSAQRTWELSGGTWTEVADTSASPFLRDDAVMAYDAARGVTVLFGGTTGFNGFLGDTWEWDGNTWTEVAPTTSPPARSSAAMAFDAVRERIVLTLGIGLVNGARYLTDTWEYDGTTWTEVTTATRPPQMGDPSMAWDPIRERLLVWGEQESSTGSTWEYNGSAWIPSPLDGLPYDTVPGVVAYDPDGQRMMLYGLDSQSPGQTWVRASTELPPWDPGTVADAGNNDDGGIAGVDAGDQNDDGDDAVGRDDEAAVEGGCACHTHASDEVPFTPWWLSALAVRALRRRRAGRSPQHEAAGFRLWRKFSTPSQPTT